MEPSVVERSRLVLAGVIDCGKAVGDIDIHGLWDVYGRSEPGIENRMDGSWYELHVGSEQGNGIYSVMAGAEISEIGELPVEVVVKVVRADTHVSELDP